jgi:hypothetical protein
LVLSTDLKGGGYTAMGGDEVFVPSGTHGQLRIQVQRAAGLQVLVYRKPGRSVGPLKTFVPISMMRRLPSILRQETGLTGTGRGASFRTVRIGHCSEQSEGNRLANLHLAVSGQCTA